MVGPPVNPKADFCPKWSDVHKDAADAVHCEIQVFVEAQEISCTLQFEAALHRQLAVRTDLE